nr:MAG TPA: hypothetical protein [Caudoviricetes sp.]
MLGFDAYCALSLDNTLLCDDYIYYCIFCCTNAASFVIYILHRAL